MHKQVKIVSINLLLFVIASVLFITLSFAFGYASNASRYPLPLKVMYIVLVFIHLFINYHWFRKISSFKSLSIISAVICIMHIFYAHKWVKYKSDRLPAALYFVFY
jgi:hypothetical protein